MAQSLLEDEKPGRIVAGFDIDHPVRMQPGAGERRREKITRAKHQRTWPSSAGKDAGGKKGGSGAVHRPEIPACDLMDRAAVQTAIGEVFIERCQAKRQRVVTRRIAPFDPANLGA